MQQIDVPGVMADRFFEARADWLSAIESVILHCRAWEMRAHRGANHPVPTQKEAMELVLAFQAWARFDEANESRNAIGGPTDE